MARAGYDDATNSVDTAAVALGTFTVAAPTVTGSAAVGEQLATCAAPAGPGTAAYEWRRDGDQVGTGATYVAQPADLGDAVTCRITVSRTGYTDATSQADSDTPPAPARSPSVLPRDHRSAEGRPHADSARCPQAPPAPPA